MGKVSDEKKIQVQKPGRWDRLKQELIPDKEMIPFKLIIFFFVGGIGSCLPYLTLHMKEVGLTMHEIAIIYAVIPITSLIGPCISGMIADKLENYKGTLAINILLTGLFHTLLLSVPVNQRNIDFQNAKKLDHILSFGCNQQGYNLQTNLSGPIPLEIDQEIKLRSLENCVSQCEAQDNSTLLCAFSAGNNFTKSCFQLNFSEKMDFQATVAPLKGLGGSYYSRITELSIENQLIKIPNIACSNSCPIRCEATAGPIQGANRYSDSIQSSSLTFFLYIVLRVCSSMTMNSSFSMLDSVVLAKVKGGKADFGKQRIMTMLGQALAPLVAGILVDRFSVGSDGSVDYSYIFYFADVNLFLAMVITLRIKIQVEKASQHMMRDIYKLLKSPEICIFIVIVTLLGMNWGFLETYFFIYLTELGSPIYLLGITLTVGMLSGLPILFVSDAIIKKFGRHSIFVLSFVAYTIRLFGYSQITNPWLCLPFEVLEVLTYQIMWVAVATYCPVLAPKGLLATLTCLTGGAHYSLGRGIGAYLGGNFMIWFGSVKTFQMFGYITMAGGAFYVVTYYGYLKRVTEKREENDREKEIYEKNQEEMKAMI